MLVLSNYGRKVISQNIVGIKRNHHWYIELFANDINPDRNTQLYDFVRPSFVGYRKILIQNWKYDEARCGIVADEVTWVSDVKKGSPFCGYFVTDDHGLLWSERLGVLRNFKKLDITPVLETI